MDKSFRRRAFGETIWKPDFSEGKCHSVTTVWPFILYLASHYQLVDIICILRTIPLAANIFWFFTKFWPKKNSSKNEFSIVFFCKISTLRDSACFRAMHITWTKKAVLLRFTKLTFDASLHCDGVFIVYLSPKGVKKLVSLAFVKTSKSLSSCSKKKPKLGIIAPTRLLGEKFRSFSWYTPS